MKLARPRHVAGWLLALLAIAAFSMTTHGTELDLRFSYFVAGLRGSFIDQYFVEISDIVRPLFIAPATILAAMALWYRFRAMALLVPLSFGSAIVLTYAMKWLLGRERPAGNLSLVDIHDAAFPSAHVAAATSTGMAVTQLLLPMLRRTLQKLLNTAVMVLVGLVAMSRVWIGAHWLTDIIAGLFVGVVGLVCALLILRSSYFRRLVRVR